MATAKPARNVERTKRGTRESDQEPEKGWRPTDDNYGSDGTVQADQEVDTDKYERISPKSF